MNRNASAGIEEMAASSDSRRLPASILLAVRFAIFGAVVLLADRSSANVVGSDAQNFNPTTSGLDFVTVQSSETLTPGVFNLGLFANYATNSFPYYEPATGTTRRVERNNSLLGGDFNLGYGLTQDWDAGISFPVILDQKISDASSVGHYSSTGNTEVRVNTKYRLFGNQNHGMALIGSANFNRIANNPYVGEGGGPIFNLEWAGDMTISQVAVALNLGYRWRNPGKSLPASGIEPIPNQWLASGALSYLMSSIDTKVVLEVLSAFPETKKLQSATDREYSVMEALLGLKHDSSSGLSFHIGGGAGLMNGVASPDFRVYAGLNFSFGPLFDRKPVQQPRDPYEGQKISRLPRKKIRRAKPIKTPKIIEETPASVGVEKVKEVQVINRGSYNHIVLNSIEFVSNSKELLPESAKYLTDELIPALRELNRRRPLQSIVIEGHTDSLGSESFNLALSEERAAIVGQLVRENLGIDVPVQAIGLGESSPIADNGNYQGRALNRRVEVKLLYQRSSR